MSAAERDCEDSAARTILRGEEAMPQEKQPITKAPRVEDESTGSGSERHGKHKEQDEALPGKGSTKGGLNKQSGGHTRQKRADGQ